MQITSLIPRCVIENIQHAHPCIIKDQNFVETTSSHLRNTPHSKNENFTSKTNCNLNNEVSTLQPLKGFEIAYKNQHLFHKHSSSLLKSVIIIVRKGLTGSCSKLGFMPAKATNT